MNKILKKIFSYLTLSCAFVGFSIAGMPPINSINEVNALESQKEVKIVTINKDYFNTHESTDSFFIDNSDCNFSHYFREVTPKENSFNAISKTSENFSIKFDLSNTYTFSNIKIKTLNCPVDVNMTLSLEGVETHNFTIKTNSTLFDEDINYYVKNNLKYNPNHIELIWEYNQEIEFEEIVLSITPCYTNSFAPLLTTSLTIDNNLLKNSVADRNEFITVGPNNTQLNLLTKGIKEVGSNYFVLDNTSEITFNSCYDFYIASIKAVYAEGSVGILTGHFTEIRSSYKKDLPNNVEVTPTIDYKSTACKFYGKNVNELIKVSSIIVTLKTGNFNPHVYESLDTGNTLFRTVCVNSMLEYIPFHFKDSLKINVNMQEEGLAKIISSDIVIHSNGCLAGITNILFLKAGTLHLEITITCGDSIVYIFNKAYQTNQPEVSINSSVEDYGMTGKTLKFYAITKWISSNVIANGNIYRWSVTASNPDFQILDNSDNEQILKVVFNKPCDVTIKLQIEYAGQIIKSSNVSNFKVMEFVDIGIKELLQKEEETLDGKYRFKAKYISYAAYNSMKPGDHIICGDVYSEKNILVKPCEGFNATKGEVYLMTVTYEANHGFLLLKYEATGQKYTLVPAEHSIVPNISHTRSIDIDGVELHCPSPKTIVIHEISNIFEPMNPFGTSYIKCPDKVDGNLNVSNPNGTNNVEVFNKIKASLNTNNSISILGTLDYKVYTNDGTHAAFITHVAYPYLVAESIVVIPKGVAEAANYIDAKTVNPMENTCMDKFAMAREAMLKDNSIGWLQNLEKDSPIYQRYTTWARVLNENPWADEKLSSSTSIMSSDQSIIVIGGFTFASISFVSVVSFIFFKKSKKIKNQK